MRYKLIYTPILNDGDSLEIEEGKKVDYVSKLFETPTVISTNPKVGLTPRFHTEIGNHHGFEISEVLYKSKTRVCFIGILDKTKYTPFRKGRYEILFDN